MNYYGVSNSTYITRNNCLEHSTIKLQLLRRIIQLERSVTSPPLVPVFKICQVPLGSENTETSAKKPTRPLSSPTAAATHAASSPPPSSRTPPRPCTPSSTVASRSPC